MMQAVGSVKVAFLVWIVGGLLSFFGALTYAELGAMKPYAGGEYVYIRDAYGPLAGFLYSWAWCLIAKPASIATIATGIVRVLQNFSGFSFLSEPWIRSMHLVTYGQLVAVGITVFISWVNYIGVRRAGDFQVLFTLL
jgi:APA family basic amino acid/polyamine antiporter